MSDKIQDNGRPTKYRKEYDKQVYELRLLGATMDDIARFFEVTTSTVYLWADKHTSFSEALKAGGRVADAKVAKALYKRAIGYTYKERTEAHTPQGMSITVHEKEVAPESKAAIIWLKNRARGEWSDRTDVDVKGALTIVIDKDDKGCL